ncbi:MAG: ROK family glucokinase [Oscillospiraceae bacterium]|nr:ROK family glucokinase [Oscillospiraceae bacterium]
MGYRVGIDLGGTNIAVGVVDSAYRIIAHHSVPTGAEREASAVIDDIAAAVDAALRKVGLTTADCACAGIGSPGTCDSERGVVVRAYNLNWFDVPVCAILSEKLGIPVRLSNDANCAALGETVAGAARGCRNVVMITLGTGVGGGIIIGGSIYAGMHSAGAELGHILLKMDGELCTCGRRGCWEAYASATALCRQATAAAQEDPKSLLYGVPEMTGKRVFDAAEQGDETARRVVERYCEYVAAGLTDLVNALAPDMILLGGGISRQGERLLEPIRRYVAAHCFGGAQGAVPRIAAAELGNEAGIIGAAAL